MDKKALEIALEALHIERNALENLRDKLDQRALLEAIKMLAAAPYVTTCASGSSGFAAAKFAHSLCCVERRAKFMPPSEAVHGGLGCVKENDVVIMVSRGGKTVELLPIVQVVNKKKAKLIALTENLDSVLAKAADLVIPLPITRESDPLNVMATTSNLVVGAIFDALLAGLMFETQYTLEQFALIHPGGAVGERLNAK